MYSTPQKETLTELCIQNHSSETSAKSEVQEDQTTKSAPQYNRPNRWGVNMIQKTTTPRQSMRGSHPLSLILQ